MAPKILEKGLFLYLLADDKTSRGLFKKDMWGAKM